MVYWHCTLLMIHPNWSCRAHNVNVSNWRSLVTQNNNNSVYSPWEKPASSVGTCGPTGVWGKTPQSGDMYRRLGETSCLHRQGRWCGQQIPLKRLYIPFRLHGFTTQKTSHIQISTFTEAAHTAVLLITSCPVLIFTPTSKHKLNI